jgi:hypothetical protein
VADIGANRGLEKDTDRHLGIGGLRPELKIGIAKALAHGVDANEGTCTQEVLALERAHAHGILLGIDRVLICRQELRRSQLITRIAAGGRLRGGKGRRTLHGGQVRKTLLGATVALRTPEALHVRKFGLRLIRITYARVSRRSTARRGITNRGISRGISRGGARERGIRKSIITTS